MIGLRSLTDPEIAENGTSGGLYILLTDRTALQRRRAFGACSKRRAVTSVKVVEIPV
jgi:hypothetical protein